MTQVYEQSKSHSFSLSPVGGILNLVNERLLKAADQPRNSELKNYFLGYREFLETPPSPTLTDEDGHFLYVEQCNTNVDDVPDLSPSRGVPRSPLRGESQDNVNETKTSKSDPKPRNASSRTPRDQNARRKEGRGIMKRSGRVVKTRPQSRHSMETRSRACARKLRDAI